MESNGGPLFALSDEDKEVVFHPYYSKRSCMTFMLTEIITPNPYRFDKQLRW